MDHIEQLKQIRADAIARLRASDDFKLAGKLGSLLTELGEAPRDQFTETAGGAFSRFASKPATESATVKPFAKKSDDELSDELAEKLAEEVEADNLVKPPFADLKKDTGSAAATGTA